MDKGNNVDAAEMDKDEEGNPIPNPEQPSRLDNFYEEDATQIVFPTADFQSSFQLNSSENINSKEENDPVKFLCWNNHGYARIVRSANNCNKVEIKFSNTILCNLYTKDNPEANKKVLATKPFEYKNIFFKLGTFNLKGALFAADEQVYNASSNTTKVVSILHYRAFTNGKDDNNDGDSNDFKRECFNMVLGDPAGVDDDGLEQEDVVSLGLGSGWMAAATTKYIRVFSSTGVEQSVTRCPGQVVCICAHDYNFAVFLS